MSRPDMWEYIGKDGYRVGARCRVCGKVAVSKEEMVLHGRCVEEYEGIKEEE